MAGPSDGDIMDGRKLGLLTIAFAIVLALSAVMLCAEDPSAEDHKFTVTFSDPDNVLPELPHNQKVANGGKVSEPEMQITPGYAFLGWSKDGTMWKFKTDKVKEDMTLVAKWEKRDAPSVIGSKKITVWQGSDAVIETNADITYFVGVLIDGKNLMKTKYIVSGSTTVTIRDSYISTLEGSHAVSIVTTYGNAEATLLVNRGVTATFEDPLLVLPVLPDPIHTTSGSKIKEPEKQITPGNALLGWYVDGEKWNFGTDLIEEDITLTAVWDAKALPTIIGGKDLEVLHGENAVITSNADYRYFVDVLLDGMVLDTELYEVDSGSTIVTLFGELTKILDGQHRISIVSTYGTAETNIFVHESDSDTIILMLTAAGVGVLIAFLVAIIYIRRH